MGVSVRVSRNARVYLPFWIAIPAYLIVGVVWLGVAVVQGCTLAAGRSAARRRAQARGEHGQPARHNARRR
jgi:hypothetical protein